MLVSELLSRSEPVIVILIGSSDSRIEAQNTMNTLKSYEVISLKRNVPVSCIYNENSKDTSRGSVDNRIQTSIVLLSCIFSGDNRELDSADLANFLNFNKVTSSPASLTALDFFSGNISKVENDQLLVSLISLTDDKTDSTIDIPIEYQAVGFISKEAQGSINAPLPIHAAIFSGFFLDKINKLKERLEIIDSARNAYVQRSIVASTDESTDEGLIL